MQFRISLALMAFWLAAVAALDGLAHSQSIATRLMQLDQQVNRIDKNRFSYEHYFPDWEDRLINEELREADYSKGGVYLVGTSNLKWATRFWALPPDERPLVHNYGIGATDHKQQFQLLRYLVEHEGLLRAGGDKSMIVLGTSYHSTGDGSKDPNGFFGGLWERHGLYSYEADRGIIPLDVSRWRRAMVIERIRISGFVRSLAYTAARQLGYHASVRTHDVAAYRRERTEWLGPDWNSTMDGQVREFGEMADYLQRRGVRVVVVFLPLGTWDDGLPFQRAYVDAMTEICRRKSVPTLDWSGLLDDEDFADSNHPNLSGVDKLHPRFRQLAVDFLRSSGALRSDSGASRTSAQ